MARWTSGASLVADGLANPQNGYRLFISRRTVQNHLVHIFAKLDIASRTQLAGHGRVPRRRDPPDGGCLVRPWAARSRRCRRGTATIAAVRAD